MRAHPRARARSNANSVSARPSPVRRADSRTQRSSSQASSLPVQTLWRKRNWTKPTAGESDCAAAAPSRNSVAGSSISRATDLRIESSEGDSYSHQSRTSPSSFATVSASPGVATHSRGAGRSAILLLAMDAAALGAALAGRALRQHDAEHAHRLQPEPQALAAVGRTDVQAGQLAYALQP